MGVAESHCAQKCCDADPGEVYIYQGNPGTSDHLSEQVFSQEEKETDPGLSSMQSSPGGPGQNGTCYETFDEAYVEANRPTKGDWVKLLDTENVQECFKQGIGQNFVVANDVKDRQPYQLDCLDSWFFEKDVTKLTVNPEAEDPVLKAPIEVFVSKPKPRWRELPVMIQKTMGMGLGLDVDFTDNRTLKVLKVKPGLIEVYNSSNITTGQAIEPGDRIVSVNGVSGTTDAIIAEVKQASDLQLVVQRGSEFEIVVEKETPDQPIGLDIDSAQVKLFRVKEGPILQFNRSLPPEHEEFQVKPNDQILEVNGARGAAEVIMELKSSKTLEILIIRRVWS